MRNGSCVVPKFFRHSYSIVTCLAVSTVVSNFTCIASHTLSSPNSIIDDHYVKIRGGSRSESSSRRRKRKRRKQKEVVIESDITDFGSPLIPDLSENEDEEKIIMALSHGDEESSPNINHLTEYTVVRSTSRKKTKNGGRKRNGNHHEKKKKRRRKKVNKKTIISNESPGNGEKTKSKSNEEKRALRVADNVVQNSKGAQQQGIEKSDDTSPKTTSTPSSKNHSGSSSLSSNASILSARQNLTSTVDESLSRLKRMNERKQEVPSKMTVKEKTSSSYTTTAQKKLIQTFPHQNRPNSDNPASAMATLQSTTRRDARTLPVNKPTPVKQPNRPRTLPTTMSLTTPWARKFILSRPKDALLPIPREFLSDGFNLVQLASVVEKAVEAMKLRGEGNMAPNTNSDGSSSGTSLYKNALRLMLKEDETENSNSTLSSTYTPFQIQKAAEVLYTMVHARYVSSPRGLDTIRRMFKRNTDVGIEPIFGRCCRINCNGMPLLPIGISDKFDIWGKGGAGRKAMRYCPSCNETFYMWESKVDGAAWGTSFAHLFLMAQGSEVFPLALKSNVANKIRQPPRKIFGFRIHPAADANNLRRNMRTS